MAVALSRRMGDRTAFWLIGLTLWACTVLVASQSCADFVSDDEDGSYWSEVAQCGGCVSTGGCGYCLSTLRCVEGTDVGPSDGSPCPNWLFEAAGSCPAVPQCDTHADCGSCAAVEDCAWCASENQCMTVTEIFNQDCKATVFDPPCPTSFVEDKQVVGNLAVIADPMFGGGEFTATDAGDNFRFAITKEELVARSVGDVTITGGASRMANARGGEVEIRAGDGASTHGGQGGSINLRAGDGYGQAVYGAHRANKLEKTSLKLSELDWGK